VNSNGLRHTGSVYYFDGVFTLMEQTFILFKPDCVQRRLVGRVLTRLEDKGLNVVAMKMLAVTPDLSRKHYAEHINKPFYPALEKFITASPVIAAVIEGLEAIRVVREMLGATSGLKAASGTIRGDYSSSRQMNLIHASDGPEAARREIDLYFKPAEIHSYAPTIMPWLRAADE
jgi:nucleoside-diphosphate kinase